MQRLLDILLSSLFLALLAPMLVPVILLLRFTGEGEVFFRQQRVGRSGQIFSLLKFATMLKNSPNMGTGTVTLKDDPRVLPAGKFLRRTKINELPQLINILTGEMSLIGPRPQTRRCFEAFPEDSQQEIIKVRPGLSGVGSIIFRSEEDMMHASSDPDRFYDEVIMPYKGDLECWFVMNYGMSVYLKIMFLTAWVVVVPSSTAHWRSFKALPTPPDELVNLLHYPR
ncbi:sugar transferase [Luminiphilus sp.]|nr:sugar transferase [Luminiphilus sp.]